MFINNFLNGDFDLAKKMYLGFPNHQSFTTYQNFARIKLIIWKVCIKNGFSIEQIDIIMWNFNNF